MNRNRSCSEPYCANSGIPRGCYEVVNGFLCDSCEAKAEREDWEKEYCPICGDYRREHPDDKFCFDASPWTDDSQPIPADDERVQV